MRYLRIILAVFLILSITATPVLAQRDNESKADALNMISILKGSGTGYNLEGQLKRSEASTFIVRFLGKEDYVMQNQARYSTTRFPDVKSTDWFAPYVGYCADQGILAGYVDGSFGPNDFVSEKAFLKMVLCALGYVYGDDFNWSNVYQAAYDTGIVTDYFYSSRTADNTQYIRENVVEVLYNALTKENVITGEKQILSLINQGIITKEVATIAGFLTDSVETQILSITPIDNYKVSIKLNEYIKPIAAEDIVIYESSDIMMKLKTTVESQSNDEIIIGTAAQVADRSYSVELSGVVDLEGNKSGILVGTFIGYRTPELKSDFFRVSKVEPMSKNTVNLYFTHPININSEIPTNYEIYENDILFEVGATQTLNVKLLGTTDNAVMITLKNKMFTGGTEYMLKVSGNLSSAYGVKLNEMQGDSIRFKGKDTDNEEFKMVNMAAINNRTLQVDFNMELNPTIAQQVFSYYITDSSGNPISISKAVVSSDGDYQGRSVLLTLNTVLDKTKNYNIMINNINDITRQFYITETSYTFSGYYPDSTSLTVVNVSPIDAGTLAVFFDRPLDKNSAAIASNFNIMGITHSGYISVPTKTYYDAATNPYLLKLFLPADKLMSGSSTYKLRIMPSLQDYTGANSKQILEYGFNGNGSSTAKPIMSEAVIIAPDAIRVKFNKEIAMDVPNLLNTNYTLECVDSGITISRIPTSVMFYNATTMILRFDSLEYDKDYTLKFDSLKDYSGANTRTKADGSNTIGVTLGK